MVKRLTEEEYFKLFIKEISKDDVTNKEVYESVYSWIGSFLGEKISYMSLMKLIEEKMKDHQSLFNYHFELIQDAADNFLSIEFFGL